MPRPRHRHPHTRGSFAGIAFAIALVAGAMLLAVPAAMRWPDDRWMAFAAAALAAIGAGLVARHFARYHRGGSSDVPGVESAQPHPPAAPGIEPPRDGPGTRSPGGRYDIRVSSWEARMSHWIETPEIVDTDTRRVVLQFRDPNWSLDESRWIDGRTVVLVLRKYPGNRSPSAIEVTIDCEAGVATLDDGSTVGVSALEVALDAGLRKRPLATAGRLPG